MSSCKENINWKEAQKRAKATQKLAVLARIAKYNENPCKCINCEKTLDYDSRAKKFCNQSCAATYNNKKREKKSVLKHCKQCGKEKRIYNIYKQGSGKFCSHLCQREYEFQTITLPKFYCGEVSNRGTLRRILLKLEGEKCSCCEIKEWNNKKIVFEVDHINGNSNNDLPSNLRLLCPNCHSQTKTFKGRNKGKGRKSINESDSGTELDPKDI
jgi:hypothetical protein